MQHKLTGFVTKDVFVYCAVLTEFFNSYVQFVHQSCDMRSQTKGSRDDGEKKHKKKKYQQHQVVIYLHCISYCPYLSPNEITGH